MEKIFLGVLLALIPVVNFCLAYYFSKKDYRLHLFKEHWSCYFFDWIFVPFNFFVAFSINIGSVTLSYALLVSVFVSFFIHWFWINIHKREKIDFYMYDLKADRFTRAGIVHFIFFVIELALVSLFFIFSLNDVFSYLALFLIACFFLSTIPSSRHVHGKVKESDGVFLFLGLAILAGKLIWMIV